MARRLCEIWAALAKKPDNKQAVADARARVRELLEHVDDCHDCRAVSEQVQSPEFVFGALAGDDAPLTKEEQDLRARLNDVLQKEAADIDVAVDALLADMPDGHNSLAQIAPGLTGEQLVSGVNAVNVLVRSFAARDRKKTIALSTKGLRLGAAVVADRRTIVSEIADVAGVALPAANKVFDWQLVAGESVERLYRGLRVEESEPGTLWLAIDHGHADEPLATRWRRSETADFEFDFLPKPIREYVEEIVVLDQAMAPVLDEAAAGFQTAGDANFSKLLSAQSREAEVERQKLIDIIAGLNRRQPAQRAVVKSRTFFKRPKLDYIVIGEDRVKIVDYVKGFEMKKKAYFGKIAATNYTGTVDLKPLKKHASYCMTRSAARLKLFDKI